jgi:hypothetical protein
MSALVPAPRAGRTTVQRRPWPSASSFSPSSARQQNSPPSELEVKKTND